MKRISILLLLAAAACSTSTGQPKAPAPGQPKAPPPATQGPAPTPTPGIRSRLDPTVIEETETSVIRRLPKTDYVKVDDRHVKLPILGDQTAVEFYKEDDKYYYVSEAKALPEEIEAKRKALGQTQAVAPGAATSPAAPPPSPGVGAEDFESIVPPVASNGLRLEDVAKTGLPDGGMWRASFAVADMNGDGIPDIVAPPNRMGDGKLRIWLGDGKGRFSAWPLSFTDDGKPSPRFTIDYGAVAVGRSRRRRQAGRRLRVARQGAGGVVRRRQGRIPGRADGPAARRILLTGRRAARRRRRRQARHRGFPRRPGAGERGSST